ncbi:hypothetical protein [Caulobacter sp. NIBR2454]|uniref:hypothetical protein n=1 Tax=Caulobacter sp. NIBR2454 TaxID=3015996 RepID=UPI0022B621E9|nr:hypothetical protein [Caulobacter sp. NIBR2454]
MKRGKAAAKASAHGFQINWGLLVFGVLFVFVAVIIEHPNFSDILTNGGSVFFSSKTAIGLLKEIGFALIIAFCVAYFIERQAKQRDEDATEKARGRIAQDVIQAVFGLQHDQSYVKKVVEQTLQPKVVRDKISLQYSIDQLNSEDISKLSVPEGRFTKLTMVSGYRFLNISLQTVRFDVKYALAARIGQKFRDFARVCMVKFDGVELAEPDIEGGYVSDRGVGDDAYKLYSWEKELPPGGCLTVLVEAVSIKELSDNEVWGSLHATIHGAEFKARVRVPGLRFGLRSLTATPYTEQRKNESEGDWLIDGPILPNESVVFWWRSLEDDGEQVALVPRSPTPS